MIVLTKLENQKHSMGTYSCDIILQINPLLRECWNVVDGGHLIKINYGVHSLELVGDTFWEVKE